MGKNNWDLMSSDLCKNCFIKLLKPTKKEIKRIVLTDGVCTCEHCGRIGQVVDGIAEED